MSSSSSSSSPSIPHPAVAVEAESNWAALPSDILCSIAERLSVPEYFKFQTVCTSWASALKNFLPSSSHSPPWLMLLPDEITGDLSFFDLSENKHYRLPFSPKIHDRTRCVGSYQGWLVILYETLDISLINPVTGATSRLPSFSTVPAEDVAEWPSRFASVTKIVLSASPSAACGFVAFAVYHYSRMAFALPGSQEWTPIRARAAGSVRDGIKDAVYHNGLFFAVSSIGQLESFDPTGPFPETKLLFEGERRYLYDKLIEPPHIALMSSHFDDLLRIRWSVDDYTREAQGFAVDKFCPEKDSCWDRVEDLDNWLLFKDSKSAMLVSARDARSLQRNCIYTFYGHIDAELRVYDFGSRDYVPPQMSFPYLFWLRWYVPSLS